MLNPQETEETYTVPSRRPEQLARFDKRQPRRQDHFELNPGPRLKLRGKNCVSLPNAVSFVHAPRKKFTTSQISITPRTCAVYTVAHGTADANSRPSEGQILHDRASCTHRRRLPAYQSMIYAKHQCFCRSL